MILTHMDNAISIQMTVCFTYIVGEIGLLTVCNIQLFLLFISIFMAEINSYLHVYIVQKLWKAGFCLCIHRLKWYSVGVNLYWFLVYG